MEPKQAKKTDLEPGDRNRETPERDASLTAFFLAHALFIPPQVFRGSRPKQ